MLYGQLKAIVEADEPKLDDEGNPIEEPVEAPKKTKKQKELEKLTSDGVGNDNDDMSNKISQALKVDASLKFNNVVVSNNKITAKLKHKKPLYTLEEMNADKPNVLLTIKAVMGNDFDKYNLGDDLMINEKEQTFTLMAVKKEEPKNQQLKLNLSKNMIK